MAHQTEAIPSQTGCLEGSSIEPGASFYFIRFYPYSFKDALLENQWLSSQAVVILQVLDAYLYF